MSGLFGENTTLEFDHVCAQGVGGCVTCSRRAEEHANAHAEAESLVRRLRDALRGIVTVDEHTLGCLCERSGYCKLRRDVLAEADAYLEGKDGTV